ncbi:MFS transporter [Alteromonas oceanisediminis]|uniref:MFS transporter n=1 Tax=Alteromonas oceanisediminis TaxID=2836180 RepID=UPI001BDAD028|nr:MFS transporter [Alteromonas oceanisediminis]MBT0588041.1 MFS transporter [Alteromonas oceanisediminis]
MTSSKYAHSYFLVAFCTMACMAYINFLPAVVDVMINGLGLSQQQAGEVVAINGYGGLLGLALAVCLGASCPWRKIVVYCLVTMMVLDLTSPFTQDGNFLVVWRFFSGVMGGVSMGIMFSFIARLPVPDKAFGLLLFLQFVLGSLVIYLLPELERSLSQYSAFHLMAGLALLGLGALGFIPSLAPLKNVATPQKLKAKFSVNNIALMLAIFSYQLAASAIWAYASQIGQQFKIPHGETSTIIAITGLLGLVGASWPVFLNTQPRRYFWTLVGIGLSVMSAVILLNMTQTYVFTVALGLLFLSWPAVVSYTMATLAERDADGQLSTIAGLFSFLGLSSGPLLAAGLVSPSDFSSAIVACAFAFLVSGVINAKAMASSAQISPINTQIMEN